MEKQLTFEIPARKVWGEVVNVLDNGIVTFRYLEYFSDNLRVYVDRDVPTDNLVWR